MHRSRATWIASLLPLLALLAVPEPSRAQDIEAWDRVLRAHAHDGGMDYAGLRDDPAARRDLTAFLRSVATMSEDAPLASWLDAYNAIVVAQVLDHYPIASVRDVPGFFDQIPHTVARRPRTLDAIENQVIRARFPDARVHAALNCGARSCPPLQPRAFRQETLDTTLDALARAFVAHDARIEGGNLVLSSIFEWYASDFTRDGGSVVGWLRRNDGSHRFDAIGERTPIRYVPYDWRLNDHPR